MKLSELKKSIKNEIISVLSEEEKVTDKQVDLQKDFNKEVGKSEKLSKKVNKTLEKTKDLMQDLEFIDEASLSPVGDFYKGMYDLVNQADRMLGGNRDSIPQENWAKIYGKVGDLANELDMLYLDMEKKGVKIAEEEEPTAADLKKKDSVSTLAKKMQETQKEMKSVLAKWKKAEEPEKTKLLNRLKELTKIKKELESML